VTQLSLVWLPVAAPPTPGTATTTPNPIPAAP